MRVGMNQRVVELTMGRVVQLDVGVYEAVVAAQVVHVVHGARRRVQQRRVGAHATARTRPLSTPLLAS